MIDLYNSLENNVSVFSVEGDYCCNDIVVDLRVLGVDIIMSYFYYGMY